MPNSPDAGAVKLLEKAAAKARDWHGRMARVHNLILSDVQHPNESMYQVWGFHLLPSADMSEAKAHLKAMEGALARVSSLAGDIERAGFLSGDRARMEQAAQGLQQAIDATRSEARAAANAVQHANMKVANRDIGVAEGLVAADKFVMEKAPEVMGDIVLAITKSEHAKSIIENGAKVGLTAVAHLSADLQHINIEGEIASIQDAAIEAAIDIVAGFVPASKGPVKKALFDMMKAIIAEVAKAGHGKHGDELHAEMVKAVNKGVMATLEKLAQEHPVLKNSKLRAALIKPVMKAVMGAEKAAFEGGSVKDGFTEGLVKGVADVAVGHAGEKGMHGAKDHPHHKPGAAAKPAGDPATTQAQASWLGRVLDIHVAEQPAAGQ